MTSKRYVAVYLISLCICSLGCSVYILWEAGVQVGLLGDLEAILWALLVLATVVGLLMASVQWVWHACFTIALFNVIVFTYLFTLPFRSDDATDSLEADPVLTWSLLALYAFELGAVLPLLQVFAVIVSLKVTEKDKAVKYGPRIIRELCQACLKHCNFSSCCKEAEAAPWRAAAPKRRASSSTCPATAASSPPLYPSPGVLPRWSLGTRP